MRRHNSYAQEENFWPSFTDVMMAFSLVLVLFLLGMIVMNLENIIHLHIKTKQAQIEKILISEFSKEFDEKGMSLTLDGDKQVITFSDKLLFDSGSDILKPSGNSVIARLAKILKQHETGYYSDISIEGHTDVDKAAGALRSNWHLSCARAVSVVQKLQNYKINPKILSATGFGEFRPINSKNTDNAKKTNRRIDIRLDYSANKIRESFKNVISSN